jgi:hypothetical protein
MKKYYFLLVICFNIVILADAQPKDLPFSYYPPAYDTLNQEDWPQMKKTFELFSSFKSVEEVSNYTDPHRAGFTLARMVRIEWSSTLRNEISSYLSNFLDQLLQGHSYLKIESVSMQEFVSANHPVYLPKKVMWALFIIDNETACTKINNIWIASSGQPAGSYLDDLSEFTFWLFDTNNFKYANEFYLKNYPFILKNHTNNAFSIDRIKLKCEVSGLKDQKKAWNYLWDNSELNNSNVLNDKAQFLWYDNIIMMEKVFGDLDLETIIDISNKATSTNKKYIFLYSACFNINHQLSVNPDFKVSESTINYLNKAIEELKIQNTQLKKSGPENDFLMNTYGSMKSNLLKTSK